MPDKDFSPMITGDGDDDIRAARATANGTSFAAPITLADRAAFANPAPRGDPNAPQGSGSPLEPTAPSGNPLPGPAKGIENQYTDSPSDLTSGQNFTPDRDSPKPYEKPGVYAPPAKLKSEVEDK